MLQRVSRACVRVGGETVGEIGAGLLVLLGVGRDDTEADARYLLEKILNVRVFDDAEGRMNLSLVERGGSLLVVSQFTLHGDARKGRRPSWFDAAAPELAEPLYDLFVAEARKVLPRVETGGFRQTMEVELVNQGPVTILLDSKRLF
ncbi:MAG TPA: D-aminoacyl-tRNA deacylase [Pyrinomonadaceae bacterium]|nr:D-aminoacyl-tRNA deacylase [Pyrinomonadaceae bacterium]